jgi:hypothetical protein
MTLVRPNQGPSDFVSTETKLKADTCGRQDDAMTDGWGTVLSAVIAVAGTLAGLHFGRRQVADQATVEHGQWLRGQRQDAYVQFLDAWDAAMRGLQDIVDGLDSAFFDEEWRRMALAFKEVVDADVARVWGELAKPLERAHLLGPESVERAVEELQTVFGELGGFLHQMASRDGPPEASDYQTWSMNCLPRAHLGRLNLVQAAKETLRQAPKPAG